MRSPVSALSYNRINTFSSHTRRITFPFQSPKCPRNHRCFAGTRVKSRQAADDPNFTSIIDNPPNLVRTGRRHGPGLIILALIPLTAFALGTWQVQRLDWKSKLIAKFEDRLVRDPLPLPPHIDPSAIKEFDYRRIFATGHFRHDQEMLIGPRLHDGKDGYLVITPLERDGKGTSVLVNRGWIEKKYKKQTSRPDGLPQGEVTVEGLLREPWKKNYFTPDNSPQTQEFYFPDVEQMAKLTGSQPVWIEETMEPDLLMAWDRAARGIPIGRPAEVNLRNNHAQYIFTWYALAAATSVMLWMVVKKPSADIARRVRQNKEWS
ncbi:putative cox1 assembly protein [Botrytis fragariae]|uniref:SURF1-like protein n=1 Tax=Botrytis fragariae TaxID=1964551 RepID=A0A8H6ENN7_9HELO|nr:putative cox1 assembly protein [Botrytis fragariae]KAF5878819.1 putative cox1 assembly protein [Botrytis fragariae]